MVGTRTSFAVAAFISAAAIVVVPARVEAAQPPSSAVTIPTNNSTVSGTSQLLDAGATPSASQVHYEITGGTLTDSVVATGIPTYYGWLALWNTTAVPNGTYSLQSVASYTASGTATSAPVTVTVNNPPPSTSITIPTSGAIESSANNLLFDATASPGVTQVVFNVSGSGISSFSVTATPTIYGWIGVLPGDPGGVECAIAAVSVQSVATYPGGVSGTSAPVPFTVDVYVPQSLCSL
jgi:hypothetical protein